MNKIIKSELEKIRAHISYDDSTRVITIPQAGEKEAPRFQVGKLYRIELAPYIVNEPATFTLSTNWNKGIVPKSYILQVQVVNVAGKMIQVDGSGYDVENDRLLEPYTGLWLPQGGVTIIQEI